MSNDFGRISKDHGVRWAASNNGVRTHHTMATQDQLAFGAQNDSSRADPTALPYSDSAALCDGLFGDGQCYVFIRVDVVLDKHRRSE